jgi:hypothetical protein
MVTPPLGCRRDLAETIPLVVPPEGPYRVCAVTRRCFPVGASPTRRPLQPEAIGAGMEVARRGELLLSRHRQPGVSSARHLHSGAVAPVVALQAQGQATQGRSLSALAPLRALRARTPEPAWARRAVGEGVRSRGHEQQGPVLHPAECRATLACPLIGDFD